MPWSPVPKFPEIMKNLQARGYIKQVGGEYLRVEIIRTLGLTAPNTIRRCIETMCVLGYIEDTGRGFVFNMCQGEPGVFPADLKAKATDNLDEEELKSKYGV
jgi:hypothetical protein